MRKLIWTITIATAVVAAAPAYAGNASKEESIGVGAGGIIGALAGGPAGFIIGAAVGAKLGDAYHRQDTEIGKLDGSLAEADARIAELEQNVDTVTARLDALRRASNPELVELLHAGIALDLGFRTDEHELARDTGERLAELGELLASAGDVRVRLDGYADERGAADYNLELSTKRVEFVRDTLVSAGIDPVRIDTRAHGESKAIDDSPDSYALERRVSVTLFMDAPSHEPRDDTQTVASTPE